MDYNGSELGSMAVLGIIVVLILRSDTTNNMPHYCILCKQFGCFNIMPTSVLS
jgi:hypothetical protein